MFHTTTLIVAYENKCGRIEDALCSPEKMAVLSGVSTVTAASTEWKTESKVITATSSVTSMYTSINATGTDFYVFLSSDGRSVGTQLTYSSVATSSTYVITSTRISVDQATSTRLIINYTWTSSATTKAVSFNSDDFSASNLSLEGEAIWVAEDGTKYPATIRAPKIKLSDTFSIPGSNSGGLFRPFIQKCILQIG